MTDKRGLRAWDEIRRLEADLQALKIEYDRLQTRARTVEVNNEHLRADNARLRRLISAASDILGGWDTEAGAISNTTTKTGSEWTKPTVTAHPPPPSIPKPWEEASDE